MLSEDIWSEVVSHPEGFILSNPHKASDSDYFPLSPLREDDYELIVAAENPFEETWVFSSSSMTESDFVEGLNNVIETIAADPSMMEELSSLPESPASSPLFDMEVPLSLPLDVALALEKSLVQEHLAPPSIAFIDCTIDEDDDVIELSSSTGSLPDSPSSSQVTPRTSPSSSSAPSPVTPPSPQSPSTTTQAMPFKITFTHDKKKKPSPKKKASVKTKTKPMKKKKTQKPQKPLFYESEESDSDIAPDLFDDDEEEIAKKKKRKTKKSKDDGKTRIDLTLPTVPVPQSDPARTATVIAFLEKGNNFAPEFLARTFSTTEVLKMRSNDQTDVEGDIDIL
eukprot:TRINITY_DN12935_c0_g1_i1.p1 TRINITY_DN12935_c0_g1~~TRINITY_DN12935_c0_g1_i1.p1  ORF type:complete len:339 (-),score=82.96 TRINITY_DN12935_c0_g1_i1:195-1211(-)